MQTLAKKSNDLNINLIKTSKFKFVNIQVSFTFDIDYKDIAALNILHNLLTTRNQKYPTFKDFSTYLEENYGMNVRGNFYNRGNVGIFNIYSSALDSKYTLGENMLQEQINTIYSCIFEPVFTNEALDEVKMIYIEKLKEKLNRKTYILKKKINETLDVNTPYGINIEGDISSINEVSIDKINEVYKKLINSNCSIYVCGDLIDNIEPYFAKFNLKSKEEKILNLSYLRNFNNLETMEYDSSFLQSAISLIYECNINYDHKLYYALKVFIEMLNYDLFKIIREEYNYCYYIYAISNNYLNTIEIVSEIDSQNLNNIINLINEIIASYENSFDNDKFQLCKNKIFTYIKSSFDSPRDLIDIQFGFDFNKLISNINELEDKYSEVTKEDVKLVAKQLTLKLISILKEGKSDE